MLCKKKKKRLVESHDGDHEKNFISHSIILEKLIYSVSSFTFHIYLLFAECLIACFYPGTFYLAFFLHINSFF
jgi:hypothetical protein